MSSGPRDPEARAPRPDRRDWPKAKLVVPENALREAGMRRSPFGTKLTFARWYFLGRQPRQFGTFLPSRPGEFHPEPLTGRVGDWRAGLGRSLCSPLTRSFVCECHIISTMPRFQPPPRRTQRAIFWHYALLFASPQSLWDLSCRGSFPRRPVDPVAVEQPQGCIRAMQET